MGAKIIPFIRSGLEKVSRQILNFPRIISFEEVNDRTALEELTATESLFEKDEGSKDRCVSYSPFMRDFNRGLRQGNPGCLCCICDGYSFNCPAYTPR